MRLLVLQHIACEPPGVYEDVMRERGDTLERVQLDEGELLPGLDAFDAIVAMGGPMSVNDEDEHPWLVDEKRLIADAVRGGRPFFGACLGVQLLASSLGARVYAGGAAEVGVLPVTLTDEAVADPVFGDLPRELPSLQWHGDTFDLPDGAVRLAGSAAYPNQAFRFGDVAYGVQFHLEVTESMAAEWAQVPAYEAALASVRGPGALDGFLAEFDAARPQISEHARGLFARWATVAEKRAGA